MTPQEEKILKQTLSDMLYAMRDIRDVAVTNGAIHARAVESMIKNNYMEKAYNNLQKLITPEDPIQEGKQIENQ